MNNMCVLDNWVGYDYKSIALPAELQGHNGFLLRKPELIKNFFLNNLNDETLLLHYLKYLSFLHLYLC
jgi:hypothetical protein